MPATVTPLLLRPGARYVCFGDGACCTDLHLIGPLTRSEVVQLKLRDPSSVRWNETLEAPVLRTVEGRCVNLAVYPVGTRCAIHDEEGAAAKPSGCRRFPYRLIATPRGGRVVTEHRCPCRTMGDRPPLNAADARASLQDASGRLQADVRIADWLRATRKTRISFDGYARIEAQWIAKVLAGDDPIVVLDAEPMPRLRAIAWSDVAVHLRARIDGSACAEALGWFGDVILALEGSPLTSMRARPWKEAFDRAEARSPRIARGEEILSDWVADTIWAMEWAAAGTTLEAARWELTTRVAIAREVARQLRGIGVREDRAMAEAVAIAELGGASGVWGSVMKGME